MNSRTQDRKAHEASMYASCSVGRSDEPCVEFLMVHCYHGRRAASSRRTPNCPWLRTSRTSPIGGCTEVRQDDDPHGAALRPPPTLHFRLLKIVLGTGTVMNAAVAAEIRHRRWQANGQAAPTDKNSVDASARASLRCSWGRRRFQGPILTATVFATFLGVCGRFRPRMS